MSQVQIRLFGVVPGTGGGGEPVPMPDAMLNFEQGAVSFLRQRLTREHALPRADVFFDQGDAERMADSKTRLDAKPHVVVGVTVEIQSEVMAVYAPEVKVVRK